MMRRSVSFHFALLFLLTAVMMLPQVMGADVVEPDLGGDGHSGAADAGVNGVAEWFDQTEFVSWKMAGIVFAALVLFIIFNNVIYKQLFGFGMITFIESMMHDLQRKIERLSPTARRREEEQHKKWEEEWESPKHLVENMLDEYPRPWELDDNIDVIFGADRVYDLDSGEARLKQFHHLKFKSNELVSNIYPSENDRLIISMDIRATVDGSPFSAILPYTIIFDNHLGSLPTEQFIFQPSGPSWDEIEKYEIPKEFKAFVEREEIKEVISSMPSIGDIERPTIGLHSVSADAVMTVYRGEYDDALRTNHSSDFMHPQLRKSMRTLDSDAGRMAKLSASLMYNQLCVDLMVMTRNNVLVLVQRPAIDKVSNWPRCWNTPLSFVTRFDDLNLELGGESGTTPNLDQVIRNTLIERFKISAKHVESIDIFGITRSMMLAGSPTVHGIVKLDMTFERFKKHVLAHVGSSSSLVRLMNEDADQGWYPDDGSSSLFMVNLEKDDPMALVYNLLKKLGRYSNISPLLLATLGMWLRWNPTDDALPIGGMEPEQPVDSDESDELEDERVVEGDQPPKDTSELRELLGQQFVAHVKNVEWDHERENRIEALKSHFPDARMTVRLVVPISLPPYTKDGFVKRLIDRIRHDLASCDPEGGGANAYAVSGSWLEDGGVGQKQLLTEECRVIESSIPMEGWQNHAKVLKKCVEMTQRELKQQCVAFSVESSAFVLVHDELVGDDRFDQDSDAFGPPDPLVLAENMPFPAFDLSTPIGPEQYNEYEIIRPKLLERLKLEVTGDDNITIVGSKDISIIKGDSTHTPTQSGNIYQGDVKQHHIYQGDVKQHLESRSVSTGNIGEGATVNINTIPQFTPQPSDDSEETEFKMIMVKGLLQDVLDGKITREMIQDIPVLRVLCEQLYGSEYFEEE